MLTLSGGSHGGEEYDATAVAINGEFVVETSWYRKVSEDQAIYLGEIPAQ